MFQLISLSDFAPYKSISSNIVAANKVDMYIIEAQKTDLAELMGRDFFFQLLEEMENSPVAAEWDNLFNGVEYNEPTHQRLIKYEGIKPVLIYYSYARFIRHTNHIATAHSLVIKKDEYSEPVSEKTIGALIQDAKSMAVAYWNDVTDYLHHYRTLQPTWYELWQRSCDARKNKTSVQISAIGKYN